MNWVAVGVFALVVLWAAAGTPIIWVVVIPWVLALVTGLRAPIVYLAMAISLFSIPISLIYRVTTCNGSC